MSERLKGMNAPEGHCRRCAKALAADQSVWLELDQRTGSFTNTKDVPEDVSQGEFEFGPDCAEKELNLTALKRREVSIPFARLPVQRG